MTNSNNAAQNDPTKTLVWLKKNEKYTPEGRQPYLKGFVNISREQIEALLATEPDQYGCYKLDAALWTSDQQGVLKGSVQPQKPRDGEQFSSQPKRANRPYNGDNF
jgi:hypothetical protein